MGYKSKFKGAEIDARLEKMVNVTYAELVTLRDEGKLIAGQMYRMTDYETTCTWENTQVAGHPFDLVLTALDNKTLDEKCSAIWSERDTDGYFANSNLPAWDVRYCLDNNKSRFDWAKGGKLLTFDLSPFFSWLTEANATLTGKYEYDGTEYHKWEAIVEGELIYILTETDSPKGGDLALMYIVADGEAIEVDILSVFTEENGKGVIYRLIDESENSVPYDFKNIMFMRPLTEGRLDGENGIETFCYTFCCIDWETYAIEDQSVKEPNYCCNNKFATYCPDNVFLTFSGSNCYSNTFGDDCCSNTFGNYCYSNTFGSNCSSNTFGDECYFNTFGEMCFSNTFGNYCYSNTFGNSCHSNTFEYSCYSNIFGEMCFSNTFGSDCNNNNFGGNCYSNTFGSHCYNINFGGYCYSNTFGIDCYNNNFGVGCPSNTFENYCYNINFGGNCSSNTFGNRCYNINFGESPESLHDYYQFNTFMGDNHDIDFYHTGTGIATSNNQVQYYIFTNGAREVSLTTNVISAIRDSFEAIYVIGVLQSTKPRQVKLSDLVN